jgi:hypothetical protein
MAFQLLYVHDYTRCGKLTSFFELSGKIQLCRQQAEIIQNYESVCNTGHGKARHRKHRRLKLYGNQFYERLRD